MNNIEILDFIYNATHYEDEDGNMIPSFASLKDICDLYKMTEEELIEYILGNSDDYNIVLLTTVGVDADADENAQTLIVDKNCDVETIKQQFEDIFEVEFEVEILNPEDFFEEEPLEESFTDEVFYHGSTSSSIDTFIDGVTNWFTKSEEYAREYFEYTGTGCLYKCNLDLGKVCDIGKTGAPVFAGSKIFSYVENQLNQVGCTTEDIQKLVDGTVEEGWVESKYQLKLSTIIRSETFRKMMIEKGYGSVKTLEYSKTLDTYVECYGVFDNHDIKIIDKELIESLNEAREIKNIPHGSCYILKDGNFYNLDYAETHDDVDTDELPFNVDEVIQFNDSQTEYGMYPYVHLDNINKPTDAQYKSLALAIDSLPKRYKTFEVSFENGDIKEYNLKEITSDEIIKSIKKYYITGKLQEKIVKKGSQYQVQSEKGRNMGTYKTKKEAEKRLNQIEYFKHINEKMTAENTFRLNNIEKEYYIQMLAQDDEIETDLSRVKDKEWFLTTDEYYDEWGELKSGGAILVIGKLPYDWVSNEFIKEMFDFCDTLDNLDESLNEKAEKHNTLNPKLFDENNQLKPEVHDKILEIVDEFKKGLEEDEVKINIKDIIIVGSNASYNYNDQSDVDVHIRVDTKSLDCPDNLYPLLYSAYRSIFNKKFDINFYDIPVELYIETIDEEPGVVENEKE